MLIDWEKGFSDREKGERGLGGSPKKVREAAVALWMTTLTQSMGIVEVAVENNVEWEKGVS